MRLVPATVIHWLYLTSTSVLLYVMAVQYRAGKYLNEIYETSIGTDNVFCEVNVKEVQSNKNFNQTKIFYFMSFYKSNYQEDK